MDLRAQLIRFTTAALGLLTFALASLAWARTVMAARIGG